MFAYSQITLPFSQAGYLSLKAVNLRLNGRLYEACRCWLLGRWGWLGFRAPRRVLQSFESGHFRVELLNRIAILHLLADVPSDLF